ncbi:DNA/RNA polymerase [Atractiella rhizophila]|nr:DNA/RNA polymerase [Atractiella rhizophila]
MSSTAPITYRHLHNAGTSVTNPLRVIAHCDIDAAYAQFEMSRLSLPRDLPVAVQQWQGLIAINYPARAFGITRHEKIEDAKKKCPNIRFVHVATYKVGSGEEEGESEVGYWENARPETHKVSLDPYRRESLKILKVFSEHCPTIEKASIDEAFLDLTLPVRQLLLERYPQLDFEKRPEGSVKLDDPLPPVPSDWSWEGKGNVIRKGSAEKRKLGVDDIPEEIEKQKETETYTWTDVALGLGAEMMQRCRQAVYDELRYTCSAGIAQNKLLSKLCSAWKKPNEQTILPPDAIADFLRPLNFQKLRNLGGKRGDEIAKEFDVATVGDVWTISLDELQKRFGEEGGMWIWQVVRGVDHSEVTPKVQTKSMLSSKNFRPYITTWEQVLHWFRVLSTDLAARLTESISLSPGLWPKTLVLHARNSTYTTKSKQAPFPYTSNLSPEYITKLAEKLMRDLQGEKKKGEEGGLGKITNLSLAFNGLERMEAGQKGIEGFFGKAMDRMNGDSNKKESSSKNLVQESPPSKKRKLEASSASPPNPTKKKKRTERKPFFLCPECGKEVEIPSSVLPDEMVGDAEAVQAALTAVKAEHEDYHFAKKLHEDEFRRGRGEEGEEAKPKKTKKKERDRKDEEGEERKAKKRKKPGDQMSLKGFFQKA